MRRLCDKTDEFVSLVGFFSSSASRSNYANLETSGMPNHAFGGGASKARQYGSKTERNSARLKAPRTRYYVTSVGLVCLGWVPSYPVYDTLAPKFTQRTGRAPTIDTHSTQRNLFLFEEFKFLLIKDDDIWEDIWEEIKYLQIQRNEEIERFDRSRVYRFILIYDNILQPAVRCLEEEEKEKND